MKKWLVGVVTALSLMIAAPSFACQGNDCGPQTATGSYDAEAWNHDSSYDRSLWGYGNDEARAYGDVMVGGEMETYANADGYEVDYQYVGYKKGDYTWFFGWYYTPGRGWYDRVEIPEEASQQGFILAVSKAKSWADAKDYGLVSKSKAGAKFDDGFVIIEGSAFGENGCKEEVKSVVKFAGDLGQRNLAQEVGYDAGGGYAFSESYLGFEAYMPEEVDRNRNGVIHFNGSTSVPDAIVKGESRVEIDPYGDVRSFSAQTESMAKLDFNCLRPESVESYVNGGGIVRGVIGNGPSYGAGTATFNYAGSTFGNGSAGLDIQVVNGSNSTSVMVNGYSKAVAE